MYLNNYTGQISSRVKTQINAQKTDSNERDKNEP